MVARSWESGVGNGELWFNAAVPNFLAPGTGFMEDNFSMDHGGGHGFRMI